jgi:alanyl-tRNA synthetase
MPGKKVFLTDPYLKELNTTVNSTRSNDKGVWYSFKETIFYPQGGGQSSDKGWINSQILLDVQFADDEIWHLTDSPVSDSVTLRLDWEHRYTNMQQHTGQHILSACFKKYHNLDTVSVHLGRDITMIELNTSFIDEVTLENTEKAANQMIRDNLPVTALFTDRENLEDFNLRRTLKTNDNVVRLVQIGDIDCVGCGGTHVRSSAEVGLIKIIGSEKIRGHSRIKMKIGDTAYQYFHDLHRTADQISRELTTSVSDLPEKIELMISEKKELVNEKKRITDLWLRECANNLPRQEKAGCFGLKDLNKHHLKILSDYYLLKNQIPCLFISKETDKIHFYIRVPEASDLDVQQYINRYKSKFALRGGGGKDFAVGQIDVNQRDDFSQEQLFHSFKDFFNERSDH